MQRTSSIVVLLAACATLAPPTTHGATPAPVVTAALTTPPGRTSASTPADEPARWLIATVAHSIGLGDSRWRSDVAVVNLGDTDATVTVTFLDPDGPAERTVSFAAGATEEWRDVLVNLFGYPDDASRAGSLHLASTAPLAITSRTYNQSDAGTYGQFLPALQHADALLPGASAVLPQLRNGDDFYTNIGLLNLGQSGAVGLVTLHAGDGQAVGTPFEIRASAGAWRQANDVFRSAGAGDHEVAYATLELTEGDAVWGYASVVDRATRDPTTIPMALGAPSAKRDEHHHPPIATVAAPFLPAAPAPETLAGLELPPLGAERAEVEARANAAEAYRAPQRYGSVRRRGLPQEPARPQQKVVDLTPFVTPAAAAPSALTVRESGPWIRLEPAGAGSLEVVASDATDTHSLGHLLGWPVAVAAGDLDSDGIPDVVTAFSDLDEAAVTVGFGATSPHGTLFEAAAGVTPPPGRMVRGLSPTDHLALTDVDGDGHLDALLAATGGSAITVLPGTGDGGFSAARRYDFDGELDAFAVGEVGRQDGRPDLIVARTTEGSPEIAVWHGRDGLNRGPAQRIPLPERATQVATAPLVGDAAFDVVALAGRHLVITTGVLRRPAVGGPEPPAVADRTAVVELPEPARKLAVGDLSDRPGREIAILAESGMVWIVTPDGEILDRAAVGITSAGARLLATRVSTLERDDLVLLDPAARRLLVLNLEGRVERDELGAVVASVPPQPPLELALRDDPVDLVALRLNRDALYDLVVADRQGSPLTVLESKLAAAFTVDDPGDAPDDDINDGLCRTEAGTCTLRAAFSEAARVDGGSTIGFAVSRVAPITPVSATRPLTLDGGAGPGVVELDGSGSQYNGPNLRGGDSSAHGLAAHSFGAYGLGFGGANNLVTDCLLGLAPDGVTPLPNASVGVQFSNTSASTASRNVFSSGSGGFTGGIKLWGDGNIVTDNLFGVAADGTTALPSSTGVEITGGTNHVIGGGLAGAGNVFAQIGIYASSGGDGSVVQGNSFGLDATGAAPIHADRSGLGLDLRGGAVTVGGAAPGLANVIANVGTAVKILGCSGCTAEGNVIGTTADGGTQLAVGSGVTIGDGHSPAANTTIADNRIGPADFGVLISALLDDVTDTLVTGNRIGIDHNGIPFAPSPYPPISVSQNSGTISGLQIDHNTLASSTSSGCRLSGDGLAGATISENSIFATVGPGIDLGRDGVTPNDGPGDPDIGPNGLQNYPELAVVGTRVEGRLESVANDPYVVELFWSPECGEPARAAKEYLATIVTDTDATGVATFTHDVPLTVGPGWLTATATDIEGSTSELSACLAYEVSTERTLEIVATSPMTGGGEEPVEVRVLRPSGAVDTTFNGTVAVTIDPASTPFLAELVTGGSLGSSVQIAMQNGVLAQPLFLRTPFGWDRLRPLEPGMVLEGNLVLTAQVTNDLTTETAIEVRTPLDLAIDRIEVQQGPRTVDLNDLIRNRWLLVRVFVEDGGDVLDRFDRVVGLTGQLHVTDQGGSPIAGSPFELRDSRWVGSSYRNRPFELRSNYDSNRRLRGENAFNVILPPLPARQMTIRAELDEVYPDVDRGNETVEIGPLRFRDTKPVTFYYRTARVVSGGHPTPAPNLAHVSELMRFMRLVYPQEANGIRWVKVAEATFDASDEIFDYDNQLALFLNAPDVVNPAGFLNFVSGDFLDQTLNPGLRGVTQRLGGFVAYVNADVCGPPLRVCGTLSHEVGHMLGMGDTYQGGREIPGVNPRRPDATASGNWVEDGVFNWFDGWYAERYDRYLAYDLMGNAAWRWTDQTTWDYLEPRFRLPTAKLHAGDSILVMAAAFEDGGGELRTAYTLDGLTPDDDPGGSLTIALEGGGGGVLASTTYEPSFEVTDSDVVVAKDRFAVVLPWDDRARAIVLRSGNTVLDERPISASDPTAAFTESPAGTFDGTAAVSWEGSDPDGDPLVYSLFFSPDGELHVPIVAETTATSVTWDGFEAFAGSAPRLVLVATDGARSVRIESASFDVPDRPAEIAISQPLDGATFTLGADVSLSASALDPEDGLVDSPLFRWTSDRDGGLGVGNDRVVATLSAGVHQITASVTDSGGNEVAASVEITIVDGPVCTLSCAPTVPTVATVGEVITLSAGITADGCTDPAEVYWSIGDDTGTPGDPIQRTFTEPGSYPWSMVAASGATFCEAGGLLEVGVGGDVDPAWIVPTVAHAIGFEDSRWRSDVAVVSLAAEPVAVVLTFMGRGAPVARAFVLAPGATVQYRDVLVSLLGFADSDSVSGSLHIATDGPVAVASRTYNQSDAGTYGQFLPAVAIGGPLSPGEVAVLPQLRGDAGFYTNIGYVNTGEDGITLAVTLRDAAGNPLGNPLYSVLEAGAWRQSNDVFDGLGSVSVAYAEVRIVAGSGSAWAYASVVDRLTRDPTTIPMVR